MSALVVVGNPRDWPLAIPDVDVVAARAYLTDPAYGKERGLRVYNLCKSYRYQSLGYYVSLLAEARGHRPLPRISAIEDLQSQNLVRLLSASLDQLATKSLASIKSDEFTLSIYFGRNIAARYDLLSRQIFDLFQVPLLRAKLTRSDDIWQVSSVRTIAASDIPPQHQDFVVEAARKYFAGRQTRPHHRRPPRFDLAILHDRGSRHPASNERAIEKFEHAAQALGIQAEVISHSDLGRLGRFDGLFIRDNTFINHYTYRFSRRAAAEGLVVIDDPDSILRCNNKVYLAELLPRHGIPIPKTLLVHKDNLQQIIPTLGLPCVLKQPDSSFSIGVVKAETDQALSALVAELLEKSDLIVAQEYLPTEFDWRVGIIDRKPLFVCKYYMAPGHWQIIRHESGGELDTEGATMALPLAQAPQQVIRLALKSANLLGDGFYGVDIKQRGRGYCVIEVNDNPN
ncbi:MAG: RimK family protein, partial [Rhodospirillales bacterium]|nr:RimK family protein [Rhodospirillales bacterium]